MISKDKHVNFSKYLEMEPQTKATKALKDAKKTFRQRPPWRGGCGAVRRQKTCVCRVPEWKEGLSTGETGWNGVVQEGISTKYCQRHHIGLCGTG